MNKILDLAKIIIGFNLAGALIVSLVLSSPAFSAEEKPKYTWEYHLITWFPPHAERRDDIFPFKTESRCRTFEKRIEFVLKGAREEAPGFGWVGVCAPVKKS